MFSNLGTEFQIFGQALDILTDVIREWEYEDAIREARKREELRAHRKKYDWWEIWGEPVREAKRPTLYVEGWYTTPLLGSHVDEYFFRVQKD